MRYSLRTLLIAITLFGVLLGGWLGYRRATLCELRWLVPGSTAANTLFPQAVVVETGTSGRFEFTYYARHRNVQSVMPTDVGNSWVSFNHQRLFLTLDNQKGAEEALAKVVALDVLVPGTYVIRGRVVDRSGEPIAGATIDLRGPFVYINHFETRKDGTFTMVMGPGGGVPPKGSGYYLQVRTAMKTLDHPQRWNSPTFTLDPQTPERDVIIVIPR